MSPKCQELPQSIPATGVRKANRVAYIAPNTRAHLALATSTGPNGEDLLAGWLLA